MKKVINGKMYNTDSARLIGSWDNRDYGNFGYCEESLYQKKTGEFFIYGEGGARSKYARKCGSNTWGGGEDITPQTFEQARQWAEEYLTADEYEAAFGEVSEDDSRVQVCYSLAASTAELIRRRASELGISAGEYIDRLVAG